MNSRLFRFGPPSPEVRAFGGMAHPIDPAAPIRSLRAAAGIGGVPLSPADLARAKGCTKPTIHDAEQAGGRISVDVLRAYAEALGGTLEIRVTLPGARNNRPAG